MAPKKGKAAAVEEEELDMTPQDLPAKGAAFGAYFDRTLTPLLGELLSSLEEAVEYFEGTVRRPAEPLAWLSNKLHARAYAAENASLRDEVAALRDEAAALEARAALEAPPPAADGGEPED